MKCYIILALIIASFTCSKLEKIKSLRPTDIENLSCEDLKGLLSKPEQKTNINPGILSEAISNLNEEKDKLDKTMLAGQ